MSDYQAKQLKTPASERFFATFAAVLAANLITALIVFFAVRAYVHESFKDTFDPPKKVK